MTKENANLFIAHLNKNYEIVSPWKIIKRRIGKCDYALQLLIRHKRRYVGIGDLTEWEDVLTTTDTDKFEHQIRILFTSKHSPQQ